MSEGIGWGRKRLIHKIVTSHWPIKHPEEKTFSYNELLFVLQELLVEEGKPYLEGGPSLRGFDIFKDFVKHLLYRNLANYDSMVLITAEKGTGKSSAAIMVAREWCRLLGIKFNPRRHIAYNNSDVMNKIEVLGKFEPLICLGGRTRIRVKIKDKEHSIKIRDLVGKNDYEVLTYNIEKKTFEYQKPKETILTKKDKTYKIELENGIIINATKNHLFLTKNGEYKKVEDLTEMDELVLQTKKCSICGKEYFNKQWDGKTCSKECSKKSRIPYRISHPEKSSAWYRKYWKKRFYSEIIYRLKHNLHTRMAGAVKNYNINYKKDSSFLQLLGCSYQELRDHLEKQFKSDMSWDNYGKIWSIDHIIPVCKFNLLNIEERKKCYNYKNLQPLFKSENSSKGGKIVYVQD